MIFLFQGTWSWLNQEGPHHQHEQLPKSRQDSGRLIEGHTNILQAKVHTRVLTSLFICLTRLQLFTGCGLSPFPFSSQPFLSCSIFFLHILSTSFLVCLWITSTGALPALIYGVPSSGILSIYPVNITVTLFICMHCYLGKGTPSNACDLAFS